jgi:hypothetical protein
MSFISKVLSFFKEGSMSGTKVSSKRIIMYSFTTVAIAMIAVEALFNLALMVEWAMSDCPPEGEAFVEVKFQRVFDLVIYGYVFGIVSALATANAWSDKGKKKTENEDKQIRQSE